MMGHRPVLLALKALKQHVVGTLVVNDHGRFMNYHDPFLFRRSGGKKAGYGL